MQKDIINSTADFLIFYHTTGKHIQINFTKCVLNIGQVDTKETK